MNSAPIKIHEIATLTTAAKIDPDGDAVGNGVRGRSSCSRKNSKGPA